MLRWMSAMVVVAGAACVGTPAQPFRTSGAADAPRQAGAIVVDFVDGTTQADIDAMEAAWGVDLRLNSIEGAQDGVAIATVAGDAKAVLARIAGQPGVESAEEMFVYQATSYTPNDPDFALQWHFRKVNAEAAWDYARGAGVVVAVIDTGVAHADFDRWKIGEDLGGTSFVDGYDFVNDRAEAVDDNGHGTHVAGTIAETTGNGIGPAGLAFEARVMPLKVLSGEGYGSSADKADAIRWAADHGANVINMSLGGGGYSEVMAAAVKYAHAHGVVVVCAAGNDGVGEVSFPAAYDGALAVSATRFDDQLAPYSSYGKELDLAAPGGDMDVDQSGDGKPDGVYQNTIDRGKPGATRYEFFQGTSMATPHVAAAAALVMSVGISDPDRVEAILLESARKVDGQGDWDERHGHGVLDAAAAVRRATTDLGLGRLGALGAVMALLWLGRKGGRRLGAGFVVGALVTGTGLFVLPMLAPMFPGARLLATPLMDWGLPILGPGAHSNMILWSAALPVVLAALFFSLPKLRPWVGGAAAGAAAFLFHAAISRHAGVGWIPDGALETLWLLGNGMVALGLTWVLTRKRGAGEA
ncbi:MAG: S8 family peptidase [Myxococcota bacterium]